MEYNQSTINGKVRIFGFATYPEVIVYGDDLKSPIQHLIFGDYLNLLPEKNQLNLIQNGDWVKVKSRQVIGWIKSNEIQKNRILEVNFIDIGQGDGCHVVTPDDKHFVIDAGQEDNMFRFLSWRYNLRNKSNRMKGLTAIITHPDQDHYKGFGKIFECEQLSFDKIYHNGIVERANDPISVLGSYTKIKNQKYLGDIIESDDQLRQLIMDPEKRKGKIYPSTLYKAVQNPQNANARFQMLHKGTGFVPNYELGKEISLKILGPIIEKDDQNKSALKYFIDPGKTKNGHSIILKLEIGKLKILLGGDLNIESENYLLEKYAGINPESLLKKISKEIDVEKRKRLELELENLINQGREVFESDIAKACHHGSHHFTTEFLKCVNSIATIISSGDNESHSHPRPDALGAFGKYGRGERPLIFSTELARSHKETIKRPNEYKKSISAYVGMIDREEDESEKAKLQEKLEKVLEKIERSVAIYGMIGVRTDGEKVVISQKLEKPRSEGAKWDLHLLEYDDIKKEFNYRIKLKH